LNKQEITLRDQNKNIFSQRERNLFWIFLSLYFLLGLVFVFLGRFFTDENWYFGNSWLVANGMLPYRDFFIHHNPVFFYIYALPQYLFGPNIIVGRLTSLLLAMLTFVLVWRLSRKLGGRVAALITALLLLTNLYNIYYFTSVSYPVLEACLMILFFTALFGNMKDSIKYPLTTFLLCLVVGVRYPIDFISVLLILYLVYIAYSQWKNKRVILSSLSIAVVTLGAIMLPFIIMTKDQFIFDTITFPFKNLGFFREFGVPEQAGILHSIRYSLVSLFGVVRNFFALVAILLALFLYLVSRALQRKLDIKELIVKNRNFVLLLVFVILNEAFINAAPIKALSFRNFAFPAAAIVAGVGLARILADIKDRNANLLLYSLLIGVILLNPLIQERESRPALSWQNSEMGNVLKVGDKIRAVTNDGDKVFTFDTAFAVQAGRRVLPGMELELYSFYPSWETEKCQKYNLLNMSILLDYLSSKEAEAIVLSEGRFFSGRGQGIILDRYRPEILQTLDENYYLAQKLSSPSDSYFGDVFIYLPRQE